MTITICKRGVNIYELYTSFHVVSFIFVLLFLGTFLQINTINIAPMCNHRPTVVRQKVCCVTSTPFVVCAIDRVKNV